MSAFDVTPIKLHTHPTILRPFWILSETTRMSRHQNAETSKVNQSGFTGARDSEWLWHQLGHMQICTLTQTHASIPPLSFLKARCPSCHPVNSVKAPKASNKTKLRTKMITFS